VSRIKILPEILSNQIAAGEVVERPASVVKELVENSLDAAANRIMIEVEKGGRSLIRISDNGTGMNHDDGLLCLERYGTSKIYRNEDLFGISTLGFRGEALPSIASVSRFTLSTRDKDSETGVEVQVDGGQVKRVSETGSPVGTLISVRQLFYNIPARRKFLKTVGTEMGHIIDTVCCIAMAWPGVQFRLSHNGRIVKAFGAVSDPILRVVDILGKDLRHDLHRIEFSDPQVTVEGWVTSPHVRRTSSRGIYVYVNGRFVRDRSIQHALFKGYAGRLMKGQFPGAAVFLTVPFDRVDVNVHPTKHQIRFVDARQVFDCIAESVKKTLDLAERPSWTSAEETPEIVPPVITDASIDVLPEVTPVVSMDDMSAAAPDISLDNSSSASPDTPMDGFLPEIRIDNQTDAAPGESIQISEPAVGYDAVQAPVLRQPVSVRQPLGDGSAAVREKTGHIPDNRSGRQQQELWTSGKFSDLAVIGQYHHTYIICESSDTLFLVDQHAAHERILFEQLKNRSEHSPVSVQSLLIPETIDFGFVEADMLTQMLPDLRTYGLEIEPFGGSTFAVKSVPSLLSGKSVVPLIREMVEKAAGLGFSPGSDKALDDYLILMACHGAIKANQALTREQMKGLLKQLDQCEHPSFCPHGRPTWKRWMLRDVEKMFCRIV